MLYGAMNFPVRPILSELETISGLGFDYLELAMDPPKAHYTIVRQQKDVLLRALGQSNLGLVCHLPTFVSTADLTESLRAASLNEVIKSLELAAELGSLKAVLHPGVISGMGVFAMDEARQYALKSLEVITETAGQLGLTLCIENMFPRSNSLVNPEDFVGIFERFPGLKMTLDTAKEGDQVMEKDGVKILILAPEVVAALEGMVMDYQETAEGGGFSISELTSDT